MTLEYSKAKNQTLTCSYNGTHLHSLYNPDIESLRFVQNINLDFIPQNIIVIEPALSYCYTHLKERFKSTRLFAIRFLENIDSLHKFEKEFLFKNFHQLKNDLFNYFGEEGLLNSHFISWQPSAKAFSNLDTQVWNLIKELLKESQNILATRQFFAKRWIKNKINFFLHITKYSSIKRITLPVLICASGPSLKSSLKIIQEKQASFFIISCSSATNVLLKNKIIPDLCISTDGGFWAKKHLTTLLKYENDIPLAITSEANILQKLFYKNTIIPLAYDDNFDKQVFDNFDIEYLLAKQNGTISGTALELALSLTKEKILFCGLDLEQSKTFCHTQPNELELQAAQYDKRISTKETRIIKQNLNNESIKIYRNWFIENSSRFCSRVFRISENYNFINSLGNIQDISWTKYFKTFDNKNYCSINKKSFFKDEVFFKSSKEKIKKDFIGLLENDDFIKLYFPADYIMINRTIDIDKKQEYQNQLNKKIEDLRTKIKNDL